MQLTARKIFLIDGAGALLSAFLLGVVLVHFQPYFGIPKETLYFLAALPIGFAAFDGYCYFVSPKNDGPHLRRIAIINAIYCFISIGLAIYHYSAVTTLGWLYVTSEVVIVLLLARYEWRVADRIGKLEG